MRRRARTGRPERGERTLGSVQTLAWWLIPLAATALAIAWVALRSRPRKPTGAARAMDDLRRFQDAMERPLPPSEQISTPPRRRGMAPW